MIGMLKHLPSSLRRVIKDLEGLKTPAFAMEHARTQDWQPEQVSKSISINIFCLITGISLIESSLLNPDLVCLLTYYLNTSNKLIKIIYDYFF
jgi:hypothetical protein